MENMELIKRETNKPYNMFRVVKTKGNYTDTISVFYADVRDSVRIEAKNDNVSWNHPNKVHIELTRDEARRLAESIMKTLDETKNE